MQKKKKQQKHRENRIRSEFSLLSILVVNSADELFTTRDMIKMYAYYVAVAVVGFFFALTRVRNYLWIDDNNYYTDRWR